MTVAASGSSTTGADVVDLRVPADPAYLAVVRSTTAGLAARLDLTLDEIEDMRIAVDEACTLVMSRQPSPAPPCMPRSRWARHPRGGRRRPRAIPA